MKRNLVIAELERHADAIKSIGATGLYLFGSTARDEAEDDSDIDLFVDYDASGRFSLIDLISIKQLVEAAMDAQIDITTRDSLHPMLKHEIEQSSIRIF